MFLLVGDETWKGMALRINFFHCVRWRRGAGGCTVFENYCYIIIIIVVYPALAKQFTRDRNYVLSWKLPLWSVSNKNHYFIRAIIKLCFSELEARAISVYTLSDVLFLYFSHVGCFRRYS